MTARPGDGPFTERTPRVAAARRLLRPSGRRESGRFLAEGVQAVREALAAGAVREIFVVDPDRHADLLAGAARVSVVTERAAAGLSETTTPQGLVAVCDSVLVSAEQAVAGAELMIVLDAVSEPGNAGALIRLADAVGAGGVIFAGTAVDPLNGKCVRATAGSLFHVAIAVEPNLEAALRCCRAAGLALVVADGHGRDLDDVVDAGVLATPAAWIFGNEAHGVSSVARGLADTTVAVPIYGRAESLNVATAAAVCLYASARELRRSTTTAESRPS